MNSLSSQTGNTPFEHLQERDGDENIIGQLLPEAMIFGSQPTFTFNQNSMIPSQPALSFLRNHTISNRFENNNEGLMRRRDPRHQRKQRRAQRRREQRLQDQADVGQQRRQRHQEQRALEDVRREQERERNRSYKPFFGL